MCCGGLWWAGDRPERHKVRVVPRSRPAKMATRGQASDWVLVVVMTAEAIVLILDPEDEAPKNPPP